MRRPGPLKGARAARLMHEVELMAERSRRTDQKVRGWLAALPTSCSARSAISCALACGIDVDEARAALARATLATGPGGA